MNLSKILPILILLFKKCWIREFVSTLQQLQMFNLVYELGSFTAASEVLNISTTAVSKQITLLEQELGLTLFERSTRQLKITAAGQDIYKLTKSIINDANSLQKYADHLKTDPVGELHIFAPVLVAEYFLRPIIKKFTAVYPYLNIHLAAEDRVPDLTQEHYDVLVGFNEEYVAKHFSHMVAKPFVSYHRILCASEEYLKKHGEPKTIQDLSEHTLINHQLQLVDDPLSDKFKRVIQVTNSRSKLNAVLDSLGIASFASLILAEGFKKSKIKQVLPKFQLADETLYILYRQTPFPEPKVIKFKDFLLDLFAKTDPNTFFSL